MKYPKSRFRRMVAPWPRRSGMERSAFSTWLHGIAHHVYVDWRRTNRPADSQTDKWWEVCADDGPSPFEDAAERDLARRLFSLVERLEDGVREVVHLHYYQGLSLSETAEALGKGAELARERYG